MSAPSVVILGGGLSGMAAAYTLARAGVTDVTLADVAAQVLEAGSTRIARQDQRSNSEADSE